MSVRVRKYINDGLKVVFSLLFGGGVLFWMYRDLDMGHIVDVMRVEMNWTWMLLSFPFGVMAQIFRALRWEAALAPLGDRPRRGVAVRAIFLSYASSLLIPRVGEFARCGVLARWDGIPFARSLGTVVTERAIDTVIVVLIAGLTVLGQLTVFDTFFSRTGTRLDGLLSSFTTAGWLVTLTCCAAVFVLAFILLRRVSMGSKVRGVVSSLYAGVMSVRHVEHPWRYVVYSSGIWGCYFLHYYLTFFCFPSTAGLGVSCALVSFVVGTIAVIVPTPNGAGPWHFAVKTMLILYGVADADALAFVLIVHSVQTLLVIALGIYGWAALTLTSKRVGTN